VTHVAPRTGASATIGGVEASTQAALPPGPKLPKLIQTLGFAVMPARFFDACRRRYGEVVTFRTLFDSGFVMVFAPELIKDVFRASPEQLRAGEANAVLGPVVGQHSLLLLDGAAHLRERSLPRPPPGRSTKGRTLAVVGILGDKDARAIAHALAALVDHWIACSLPGPRGVPAEELARRLGLPAAEITLAATVEAGCEIARATARAGDRVLVFGSVYTVGPALQWLRI